jgi:uncharacterized protein YbjT (DUF2867 family)
LIEESSVPFSIVHATQFFEFFKNIADSSSDGTMVRLAPVLIQPMAADDVAAAVGRVAIGPPVNGIVEVAGPQQFRLDEFIRQGLTTRNDPRRVVADPAAGYFGVEVDDQTLVPCKDARLGEIRFETWLTQSEQPVPKANPQHAEAATASRQRQKPSPATLGFIPLTKSSVHR